MKSKAALVALCLAAGFACGWLLRPAPVPAVVPPPATPGESLDALLAYRGQGPVAARRVIDWVNAISRGGPDLLPRLDDALRDAPDRKYAVGTWVADYHAGILSCHPTLRAALSEAVSRIGGDRAVGIIFREARRPGSATEPWIDRVAAYLALVRHADRPDVREFYTGLVLDALRFKKDDQDMISMMRVTRGRIAPETWDPLAGAFRAGWAQRGADDEMAETLADLDKERAGRLFLEVLSDASVPPGARAAAARALGRLPERRPETVRLLLTTNQATNLGWFLTGMSGGRYGEGDMESDARESLDFEVMREYTDGRVRDLSAQIALLEEIRSCVSPELATALRLDEWQGNFEKVRDIGRTTLDELAKAIADRTSPR